MAECDISKMKITALKRELKLRALPITGNKAELQERLQCAIMGGDLSQKDTAVSGEDLLEEVLSDEEEKAVSTVQPVENELLETPTSELNAQLSTDNSDDDTKEADEQPKKIVLKRKMSITSLSTETEVSTGEAKTQILNISETTETHDNEAKKFKLDEKPKQIIIVSAVTMAKTDPAAVGENNSDCPGSEAHLLNIDEKPSQIIKLSALTLEERLQLRAKKFGFEENKVCKSAGVEDVDPKQIEILKKRAERFGCVLSSAILRITAIERLEKRKQRFGGPLTAPSVCKDVYAEKARQRLERFKTAAK